MNRRFWPALLLAFPGLVGCTPPGPFEFYRSALQARSEFVDSLSRVVDEKTAKDKYKVAEKVFNDRIADVKEGLDRTKYDSTFQKLSRDNFQIKNLDANDRLGMIDGMKAYANYCRQVGFTNTRLLREIDRLQMVHHMEALTKARTQFESNQPIAASAAAALAEFPNLAQMLESLGKLNKANLRFVPNTGLKTKDFEQLKTGIPEKDLNIILTYDIDNMNEKIPGQEDELKPPDLPKYPDWAKAIDQKTKWRLTDKPKR